MVLKSLPKPTPSTPRAELSSGIGALRVRSTAARYTWAHAFDESLQSFGTELTRGENFAAAAFPPKRLNWAMSADLKEATATRFTWPPLALTSFSSGVLSATSEPGSAPLPVDILWRLA